MHPFHAGSTSSGTPASHMAGLPLELPPFTGSTKCALVLLGNGNRNAFRICCADGVQPLAGAAPQKQPCPSEEQPAKSGHTAELQGPRKGDHPSQRGNQELVLGHEVRAPAARLKVPAEAKIWVPSSLQSSSATSLSVQATHPQHFSHQFVPAVNSANSKFHSHLWKGAGVAQI